MTDLNVQVKVGSLVRSIKGDMRMAERNKADAYKTLNELNELLFANGGTQVKMEEVLSVGEDI